MIDNRMIDGKKERYIQAGRRGREMGKTSREIQRDERQNHMLEFN